MEIVGDLGELATRKFSVKARGNLFNDNTEFSQTFNHMNTHRYARKRIKSQEMLQYGQLF